LVLAAVAVNLLSIGAKGVRWWVFLKPAGSTSLPLAMRATLAGAGLNNLLVANGGDAARVVFVSRASGVPSERILATLALERLFDVVGFVILLVLGATLSELSPSLEKWRVPAEVLLAVMMLLLILFVYSSRHVQPEHIPGRRARARTLGGRIRRYLSGFATSTRSLATGWRFAGALGLSMISWAGQLATFALAAAATHVSLPITGSLAALLTVNLGFVIRATPGNVGLFQFVYAITAEQFGVSRADAIAVSLLIQTLQIVPMTLLGIALAPEFIFRRQRRDSVTAPAATGGGRVV
jgi:uncharacterized protein (TIRG00374 family)